jgi:predicted aspartyl protease
MKTLLASLTSLILAAAPGLASDIPFTFDRGVPYVQVTYKASTLRFILDTGAEKTFFEDVTSDNLKLRSYGSSTRCGLHGAWSRGIYGVCASVAGIPLQKTAAKTDLIETMLRCGHWIDGLLGDDFFKGKVVTFDYPGHVVHVSDSAAKTGISALFGGHHGNIFVTVTSPAANRPLLFLVDTGATRTFLDVTLAKKLNLPLTTGRGVTEVGGHSAGFNVANFGGQCDGKLLPPAIGATDLSKMPSWFNHKVDGVLGNDFLQSHSFQIDFATGQAHIL